MTGEVLKRRVVADLGRRVVICSEAEYVDATNTGREPEGVGFPRADVARTDACEMEPATWKRGLPQRLTASEPDRGGK